MIDDGGGLPGGSPPSRPGRRYRGRVRRLRSLLVPFALSSALLASCGDGIDDAERVTGDATDDRGSRSDDGPSTTSTTATGGDGATTAPTTASDDGGGTFGTTTVTGAGTGYGLLADVDATADGTVDRVTFTFEGVRPGYRVGYVERPIVEDGSGDEVTVDGEAVLLVHFEPASGFDLRGEGRQVYRGPNELDLATRVVLDVVRASDFEASLEWAVGVDTRAGFRVRTADDPSRVIVEVEVPPGG